VLKVEIEVEGLLMSMHQLRRERGGNKQQEKKRVPVTTIKYLYDPISKLFPTPAGIAKPSRKIVFLTAALYSDIKLSIRFKSHLNFYL
jgi:hypothetical protein